MSLRFIGSYEVLERIGPVAYRLTLPPELAKLHNVFHVSMLQRYHSDESHILPMQVQEVKHLRNKQVSLVKVLWQHHGKEEATWEPEATMKEKYP